MNGKVLFHTIIRLKPRQVVGRIRQKLFHPHPKKNPLLVREPSAGFQFPLLKKCGMKTTSSFTFLNKEVNLIESSFWNDSRCDALWLYNLHYFDWLNSPEQSVGKNDRELTIDDWIDKNAVGTGVGWDPYPISLRVVNWIKWHLNGNVLSSKAQNSLAVQLRYLYQRLEYHLLANHLFANAKALVFAGLFFEGKEADAWLKKGLKILEKELPEQILADGGNFERSPMYHAIMLEDLLDVTGVCKIYRHLYISNNLTSVLHDKIVKMLQWLYAMCHNDGKIALFNDAAFSIAPDYEQLVEYAKLFEVLPQEKMGLYDLSNTGYVAYKGSDYTIIIDAGEVGPTYQPGHAHADTFSFELSKESHRIIVDSGTSCYGVSEERLRQRKTPAHNTVSIDGYDSSEVWSGFRVARRAHIVERVVTQNSDSVVVKAGHNGFTRVRGIGLHHRTWVLNNKSIVIHDDIGGEGKHTVEAFLHFHPDVAIELLGRECTCRFDEEIQIKILLDETLDVRVTDATYHPEFGITKQNKQLIMKTTALLPYKFTTEIMIL